MSCGFERLFLILLCLIRFLSLLLVPLCLTRLLSLLLVLTLQCVRRIDVCQVSLFRGMAVVFSCRGVVRTTFRRIG